MQAAGATTILLIGDYRYALTFVRSLAAAGYRVLVGRPQGTSYAVYAGNSRFASGQWQHPPIDSKEQFIAALVQFLSAHPEVALVIPLGDTGVTTLAAHATRLPANVRVAAPPNDVVQTCANKAVMCQLAQSLNIPQTPFAVAHSRDELFAHAGEIGFPCVVKAGDGPRSLFDQKAVICHSSRELEQRFATWPEGVERVVVQQFASGPRHNVQLLARTGEMICRVQTKTLRTDRPDHTGYTVESVTVPPYPEIDDYCRRLLRRLQYEGYGCAQFLIDEVTGAVSFLEINPRLGAAFGIADYCGVDFPRMGAALALSGEAGAPCLDYAAEKRIAWTYGDIQGIIRARARAQITRRQALQWAGDMLRSFIRADMHTTWSWRDPRPTLVVYARFMTNMIVSRLLPRRRSAVSSVQNVARKQ
jgi:predicted ATP-grasp superfamily ATP-dependent carboligase